jgi:hypothetical protein
MDSPTHGNTVYRDYCGNYIPYLNFKPNFDKKFDLFGSYTVASFAVDFAARLGYKEVMMFGVLDGNYKEIDENHVAYRHFYEDFEVPLNKQVLLAHRNAIIEQDIQKVKIRVTIPYYSLNGII